ncbi:MAG: GH3 auxin-responsive promoter family protein [Vicinamibacterales bacterium]
MTPPAFLVRAAMAVYARRFWRPLDEAAAAPDRAQLATLQRLLDANRDTTFGRAHGFASIRTPADYAACVPVQQYGDLAPLVERQRRTGDAALTTEAPVFYAQTSGSTGAPKYIPITPSVLATTRTEQKVFSYLQYRACPEAFAGPTLGIMGAAVEGRLDSGHTVGSVSGHLYTSMPRFVKARFVVPPDVAAVDDYTLKYLLILRLALETPDITYMGAPNPSSFLRLAALLESHRDELLRSLATGTFDGLRALPRAVRAAVAERLTARPSLAAALERLPSLTFRALWPNVALVTTWTGGSCGVALDAVRAMLPDGTRVMELGYQATEFRGTFALTAESPGGLPSLTHTYFEFVDDVAWQAGVRDTVPLEALQAGRRYQVIVTTAAGLYRYFMNDLLEVVDVYRRTPLLRFVQKGRGVTSLTGEKLYEAQVIEAMSVTARAAGLDASFYLLLADEAAAGYAAYIAAPRGWTAPDDFGARLDEALGARNIEFAAKRASGRLRPTTVVWVDGRAAEAYVRASVAAGQREGQFKPAVLQYARDLTLPRRELDGFAHPAAVERAS